MTTVELEGVEAGYGNGPSILQGLSVSFSSGDIHCVVGPNGAGKSTMLRVLAGILHPRTGQVRAGDTDLTSLRPDQVLKKGVCLIPSDSGVFSSMTVEENLRMGAYTLRKTEKRERRIESALEVFPQLKGRFKVRAGALSGGEQQMLALARASIVAPSVLLIDEPSLGLAPIMAQEVASLIVGFRETLKATVIVVEQNVRLGLSIADCGYVLDLGQLRHQGPPSDLLENPVVRETYLGRRIRDLA